jgi:hypothetical protein
MDIFNNPWVVGIGGGILSGLLVTIITRKFFESKDNKEYLQKLKLANNEVLYAIKPFIVDGEVPSKDIIYSLRVATSRKHSVDLNDIVSLAEISENLIKDVLDSSFISNNVKTEYCQKLSQLIPQESEANEVEKAKTQAITEYRSRVVTAFSIILGVFAGLLTSYVGFMVSFEGSELYSKFKILLPSFLAFLMAYFAITLIKVAKEKDTENKTA